MQFREDIQKHWELRNEDEEGRDKRREGYSLKAEKAGSSLNKRKATQTKRKEGKGVHTTLIDTCADSFT